MAKQALPRRTPGTEPEAKYQTAAGWNADVITNATEFSVALFLGAGTYARGSAPTLDGAVAIARDMKGAYPMNGRAPLIYALNAEGRQALVTDWEIKFTQDILRK